MVVSSIMDSDMYWKDTDRLFYLKTEMRHVHLYAIFCNQAGNWVTVVSINTGLA